MMTSPSRTDPFCICACVLPSFLENSVPTYVERVRPEFQWELAYAKFRASYLPRCETGKLRPSIGLEALA